MKKPFPARVRWSALWRHRWTVLNLLNQVAHGSLSDTVIVVVHYRGSPEFAAELYTAARKIVEVRR